MTTGLHDEVGRERFQTELEQNFCVSAGAGVGRLVVIAGEGGGVGAATAGGGCSVGVVVAKEVGGGG